MKNNQWKFGECKPGYLTERFEDLLINWVTSGLR